MLVQNVFFFFSSLLRGPISFRPTKYKVFPSALMDGNPSYSFVLTGAPSCTGFPHPCFCRSDKRISLLRKKYIVFPSKLMLGPPIREVESAIAFILSSEVGFTHFLPASS